MNGKKHKRKTQRNKKKEKGNKNTGTFFRMRSDGFRRNIGDKKTKRMKA